MEPIAIVGSACRFPGGASSVSRLWDILRNPKDILDDSSLEFRSQAGVFNNDDDRTNRSYLLQEDFRRFDASFFKINKKEADAMDPQNRILLETVFEAIESAGLPLERAKGSLTSVHVGVMTADHSDIQMRDPETLQTYAAIGLARSMLANRVSYFFDFKGPSETIDTACSSSLVALHHAVQSIQTGDAHQAIVAGSALFLDSAMYIAESKIHMLSSDSRSRMWDKDASGYSRGEGCAAILIKPLSKAIEDNDHVESIIRATAVNSDGHTSGITMPSTGAQVDLIRRTYNKAGLDPVNDRCQFFECHGTGTPAGDPVEAAAIQQAFFPARSKPYEGPPLYCGSIKTILGHLEGCAGLAGILKASLALQKKSIPPNLHFDSLNPIIRPHYDNLCVPTSLAPWPKVEKGPLRASVNSFGFGGTNAHAILESHEQESSQRDFLDGHLGKTTSQNGPFGPFVFSANNELSLLTCLKRMSTYLQCNPHVDLDALEATLFARRSVFSTRTHIMATDQPTLMQKLDEKVRAAEVAGRCGMRVSYTDPASPPKVLGIFTGQGAQWAGMGRELMRTCYLFQSSLEACAKALSNLPDGPSWCLRDAMLTAESLPNVLPAGIAQPMCTAIQIALVDLIRAVGIEFSAVVGHSSGEIAAAYAAGILSMRDALSIAYHRGSVAHLASGPTGQGGAMMVIGMSLDKAVGLCSQTRFLGRLEVAASNAPSSTTLSGDKDAIREAKELLEEENVFTNVLSIDVAYHSRHMVPCAERYAALLQQLDIQPQSTPSRCVWYSSVRSGIDVAREGKEQFKSQYWVDNMVEPVLFHQALQSTLGHCPDFALALEIGPHPAMRTSVRDTLKVIQKEPLPYIGCLQRGKNDVEAVADALGLAWCCVGGAKGGLGVWRNLIGRPAQPAPLKGLPPYGWDHESIHWQVSRIAKRPVSKQHPPHELLGRLHENLKHEVTWRNIFDQRDIPWLSGHVLQGQVVFPAAGYVSMAAQAADQLVAHPIATIEFQDVKILRPLVLAESSSKVETLFRLSIRDPAGSATHPSALTATFTCYSGIAGGDLSKTCEGKLLALVEKPAQAASLAFHPYRDALPPVDIKRWFKSLAELGITYSGIFRALSSLNRIWGIAEASAVWKETSFGRNYFLHPAILDVGLQIGFATFASLAKKTTIAALPTEIGRIVLNTTERLARPPIDHPTHIQAHLVESTRTEHRVDIGVYISCTEEPRLLIEGLVIKPLAEPQPSEDRKIFASTAWDVDVAHGFPSPPVAAITDEELQHIEAIERTSLFFLRNICRDFPNEVRQRLQPHYQTMLRGVEMLVDPLREGQRVALQPDWFKDKYEDIEELGARYQESVDLTLLTAVGKNLRSVVRGESEMLEHMLEDDLLGRLYSEGRGFKECNQYVAFLMKKLTFKFPRARILEIGAGTGGTTYSVLEAIGNAFASYTYTDISSGFFEKAIEKFSQYADRMEFKRFNVESPPSSQGFTESSYDIVIAANVLHATKQISQTIRHARSLLRTGGFMITVEVTGNMLRETGLMAGLEGWWLGVDDGRFPLPGITAQEWDRLLSLNGFSGIDSITYDCSDISMHNCSVFVTRAANAQLQSIPDEPPLSEIQRPGLPIMIIGGQTPAVQHAVLQAKGLLQRQTPHITVATGLGQLGPSNIPRDVNVLCLSELDNPIYPASVPDSASLNGLKELVGNAANIVWVTSGGHDNDPYSNMMIGIGRSLVSEVPSLRMQFLDFDAWDMELAVQCLMQMVERITCRDTRPTAFWNHEPELRVKNGVVLIPRLLPDRTANKFLNATRRHLTERVTLDKGMKMPIGDAERTLFPRLPNVGLTMMYVERSVSLNSSLDSPCFLCFGYLEGEDLISVALSAKESFVIEIDPERVVRCPSSYRCDSEGLIAFGSAMIASHIIDNSPENGTIMLHNSPPSILQALSVAGKSRRHRIQSTRSIIGRSFSREHGVHYLIANAASHRSITRDTGILWFFSGVAVDTPLDGLEESCSIRKFNASTIDLRRVRLAAAFELAGMLQNIPSPTIVDATRGFQDPRHRERLVRVVEWRRHDSPQVPVPPLDVESVFLGTRTYFLVGMNSDLGHSLCRFLIYHGVQHIAIASRTASKRENWVASLTSSGANIRIFNMDVTNKQQLSDVVAIIRRTMPPIAGVANAALVLEDSLFVNTTAEMTERQLRPKTEGTLRLHEEFSETGLDFFVAFSSLGTVYGNAGQSIYHAANMFMTSLVKKRRIQGLPASVLNLGMVIDVGFVARSQRANGTIEQHLESNFYTPLSESEFHHAFILAVLASHPKGSNGDVTVGIQPYIDVPNSVSKPSWYNNPQFSHMIAPYLDHAPHRDPTSETNPIEHFIQASSQSEAEESFKKLFCKKIEVIVETHADRINSEAPLADLGLDSLLAVEIRDWLLKFIGINVPLLGILGHESISSIASRVWNESTLLKEGRALREHPSPKNESDVKEMKGTKILQNLAVNSESMGQDLPFPGIQRAQQRSGSAEYESSLSEEESTVSTVSTITSGGAQLDEDQACERLQHMSFAQMSMHFMQSLLNDPTMFNVTAQYNINGPLDVDRLFRALSITLLRHDAYRTRFFVEPVHIRPSQSVAHPVTTVYPKNIGVAQDEDVSRLFQRIASHEYILSKGDTFQASLVTRSAVCHTFVIGCHHIIMDGISWHIFLGDLSQSYQSLSLPKTANSYLDFALEQHNDAASGAFEESVKYWLQQLNPTPPALPPLPLAHRPRQDFQQTYNTYTAQETLGLEAVHCISSTAKAHKATTMQFYLAVLAGLFARLVDVEDICIGVTDAGRGRFTEVVGHFTNLLPIRLHMDHGKSFATILHQTSQIVRQGMRHARVPFELLLERLGMQRSSRAAPLFQVAFNFRLGELSAVKLGDCSMNLERYQDAKTPYDLVFNVTQTGSSHLIEVTSNSDMYSSATTHWILKAYLHMVQTFATTPSIRVGDRQLCANIQVDEALSLGQGPRVESKLPITLIERFYQVCNSFPDAVAIKDRAESITYSELSRRVNILAAAISKTGVTSGDHVAVLCQPSLNTFASMLGILHVGAIYVPLDITTPSSRNIAMISVCLPKLAICDATTVKDAEKLGHAMNRMLKLNISNMLPFADVYPPKAFRDYGFLLFTSGSTGTPKGVQLTQSGIMNYAAAKTAALDLRQIKVLQQSSTSFDMSLAQVFNSIVNAGTLIVACSDSRGDPVAIAELMLRESIQLTICTPSEYSTLTTYAFDILRQCESWQYACSGGESLTDRLLWDFQRLELSSLTLVNCYGPTELSCATTLNIIPLGTKMSITDAIHTVGKPIPNTSVYVDGPNGDPQPIGFPGEICVGGRGVAIGYIGTDTKSHNFLVDALKQYPKASSDFKTVYKTGDRGYLCEDGSLVLMGRMQGDTTIKLRGFRVDLNEVAKSIVIAAKGAIVDAVVTVRGTPQFLVANVVLGRRQDTSTDFLTALRSELSLPQYMIPSIILPLNRLPTTTNGKVDRKAIAAMPLPKQAEPDKHQTRLNVSEGELKLIWKEVLGESLGNAKIEPATDFFTVGGGSLLLLRLQRTIKEKMGITIELSNLYRSSTLRNMASAVNLERCTLMPEAVNWKEETAVPQEMSSMLHSPGSSPPNSTNRVVVLTGATGFLGSHILAALVTHPDVSKIYCIAVPYGAQHKVHAGPKVLVYNGSLTSTNFGLSSSEMATMKMSMDQIVHAGSQGHCLNNYSSIRAANYTSTRILAELAAARKVPFHFISSPRVVLLSGSHSAPPESMSAYLPPVDGSEGYIACKWASEVYLEKVATMTGLPVSIHRPCSLIGHAATHDDALNSVIRYSLLSRTVPSIPNAHGFFDFRAVEDVALEIVQCKPASTGIAFHHHSSGVKVPFGGLATRLEELHGGKFTSVDFEEWIERTAELGLDDLIVSYLRANVVGCRNLDFPYLGI
ncbi:hypothetical protein BS50DRAFT_536013 [Corynespora cassiicola Philippines]|uniref:Polyketide synthase n=1 Tax=Corynespora cassiicola Philippines TaxID=1448308 RepID=A0A2T2N3Z7_CORCC|nr:hypothetical protein BS50DRAFT_536013 [Corynespora cassiicola Philippines]